MVRPVKTFDLSNNDENIDSLDRKPLIQLEPACLYKEENDMTNHSSIPQGVELKRKVVEEENNVELSDFEKTLQKIGIIPSDSWISGKSKNLWVNLARNIYTETLGIKPEEEIDDEADYIIDLPQDLARVDDIEPNYTKPSPARTCDASNASVIDINYGLFYDDSIDESMLDAAPSAFEIYK